MDFWAKGKAEAVKVSPRLSSPHKPLLQKHFLPAPVLFLSLSVRPQTHLPPPSSVQPLNPRVSMRPLFQGQVDLKKKEAAGFFFFFENTRYLELRAGSFPHNHPSCCNELLSSI
jgi:hypothetical protein